jgi:uncharacterized protein (TIGR03435 family)
MSIRRMMPALLASGLMFGQAGAQFEVASVRPTEGPCALAKFSTDGGRVDIKCASVQELVAYAFRVPQRQVDGPNWMRYGGGTKFDIAATLPQGASQDQAPEMLVRLLAERFKLAVHRESKEQSIDALVVAKGGLKIQEEPLDGNAPPRTYRETMPNRNTIHWELTDTFQRLADLMDERLKRPVLDMTGLKRRYHVVLDVATAPIPRPFADGADIATARDMATEMLTTLRDNFNSALQKIGLQLETRKAPVETIVVDRVESTPTDN